MYERLDGSVRGEERFLAVQKFNQDDETFVFLLSTRAGNQIQSIKFIYPISLHEQRRLSYGGPLGNTASKD